MGSRLKAAHFPHSQGDDPLVGWFLVATSLGLYQISYRISNAPTTEITAVIDKVMYPTMCKCGKTLSVLLLGTAS